MIILVSDGESADLYGGNDDGDRPDPQAETTSRSMPSTFRTGTCREQIVNITAMTGGEVFPVDDPEALKAVFQRIDAMRETKLEKTASELLDDFVPVCIAGLSLLTLSGCALFGLRYTPW